MAKTVKQTLNKNSSFWLNSDSFKYEGSTSSITKKLKLLAYKRAISNFVKILTKKDGFEVKFSTGVDSYTDGKTVVISSKLDENNFDLTVGLALHEASHLLLTDFKLFQPNPKKIYGDISNNYGAAGLEMRYDVFHSIFNIVEDRYIDNYVYSNAPGYRGYYQTLYDHYFRSPELAKLLKTPKMCEETVDNYISQLLNIVGLEFDPKRLKGLQEIVNVLDINNISRLTTTMDRLELAGEIYKIILKYVNQAIANGQGSASNAKAPKAPKDASIIPQQSTKKDNEEENDAFENEEEEYEFDEDESNEGDAESDSNESGGTSGDEGNDENLDILTPAQEAAAEKILDDAKKVVNGNATKAAGTKGLNNEIEILDKSDAELHKVDYVSGKYGQKDSINVLLVKNVTKEVAISRMFPSLFQNRPDEKIQNSIQSGVVLGTLLAKRMQVRNEERTMITNRLKNGKIFNRHVAMLGADVENIFYKTKTDKFKNTTIHINIDASGSMMGEKFENCIMTSVAVAKACTYLRGVNCIIAFRNQQERLPLMCVVYNSKRDHFSKIADVFPYLHPGSSTPEGLCYDVYKKFISDTDPNDSDKYLINLSDGAPGFGNGYYGHHALEHTRKVWNDILKTNVIGLSYYISEYENSSEYKDFCTMYGKQAKKIDTSNIVQLAGTINDMLMSNNAMFSNYSE